MPYVPSEKTDGKSQDRNLINPPVDELARKIARGVGSNLSLISLYEGSFFAVARFLHYLLQEKDIADHSAEGNLARTIFEVSRTYDYEGAYCGELNYAITRLIQRVPQIMVENDTWKEELRYWLYAATVEALMLAADATKGWEVGIGGVFTDIKDEYKWEVNRSYEIEQILKSGHCYDAPFYSRVIELIDEDGKNVGYLEAHLKRSKETVGIDLLPHQIVVRRRK